MNECLLPVWIWYVSFSVGLVHAWKERNISLRYEYTVARELSSANAAVSLPVHKIQRPGRAVSFGQQPVPDGDCQAMINVNNGSSDLQSGGRGLDLQEHNEIPEDSDYANAVVRPAQTTRTWLFLAMAVGTIAAILLTLLIVL